jgi:peroxiredoxin
VDLQANYRRFQEKGAEIIALAVQDVSRAKDMQVVAQAAFPILADPEHKIADAYGVYNLLGDGVAAPSVFIIDLAGNVIWSYVGRDGSDRPTADTILSHLAPAR